MYKVLAICLIFFVYYDAFMDLNVIFYSNKE